MDSEQADDAPDSNEVNTCQFEQLQEFVESMPKVELHAHLNGCIRESTLFALAKERNVTLSEHHFVQSSTFSANTMYNVRPRSLKDCFDMFAEIPKCVDDLVALRRITREALEDFAQHHVAYLELRSTPKRLVSVHGSRDGLLSKREYIETVVSVLEAFEQEEQARYERECETNPSCRLPLVPKFIVSVDRSDSIENAMEHIHLAIDMVQSGNAYVVGVDLGGNPTKVSFNMHMRMASVSRHPVQLFCWHLLR
jgi:adenosine deaminase